LKLQLYESGTFTDILALVFRSKTEAVKGKGGKIDGVPRTSFRVRNFKEFKPLMNIKRYTVLKSEAKKEKCSYTSCINVILFETQ
jgi:hypothetical protein